MSGDLTFQQTVLSNGLHVIGEQNPRAASVAVGYLVRAGSRDEAPEVAGVSHFLEHMAFKGNERLSAEEINRGFDELGAEYNAFTSFEQTVYYGAVPASTGEAFLELLTELMQPSLRQADFDMEKNVILEEIAMYLDRPTRRLFELLTTRFWNGHPLGNSVLGTSESITALTREQMHAYFMERYSPSNLILAFSGKYDWEELTGRAAELTREWRDFPVTRERKGASPASGFEAVIDENLTRVHMAVAAPGWGVEREKRFAPAILASAIGDTTGSRLYWELVDKGITDSAWLTHEASEGAGLLAGYASAAPERAAEVLGLYRGVLERAQEEGLSEEEWRRAQRKFATSVSFRAETPLGRLMAFGLPYQALGKYYGVNDVLGEVMSTTLADGLALLEEKPFSEPLVMSLGPTSPA